MYDVCVIGLGSHGSAITHRCAQLGLRVIGVDKYKPPHNLGAHHADTRMTRLIQFEGEHLLPLVEKGNAWRRSFENIRKPLFQEAGFLTIANKNSTHFDLDVQEKWAQQHHIRYERFSGKELSNKYPVFNFNDGDEAFLEPGAGFLKTSACIDTNLENAKKYGAECIFNTEVSAVDSKKITLAGGEVINARYIIICTGAYINKLLPDHISENIYASKQIVSWFKITENPVKHRFPKISPFVWEQANKDIFYGFPSLPEFENGQNPEMKIGIHTESNPVNPEKCDLTPSEKSISKICKTPTLIKGLYEKPRKVTTCFYTMTKDHEFIIDQIPDMDDVWVCSACSGHGFKMSYGLALMFGELFTQGSSDLLLPEFSLSRFK
ncbi:MAG: N-methyl-L-tryptophan oxidase [Alphaproteobacteria bacterium]|nr:N-methyl-L-tryptophan oxidase [Alphaproteobacteria bacterium]